MHFRKFHILTFSTCLILFIYSCKSKKAITTSAPTPRTVEAESAAAPAGANSLSPGDTELKAIKAKFPETTLQTLNTGYSIYSGVCSGCHKAKDMFVKSEEEWKHDVDRMAPKARISAEEKDALWKYVLAMRTARGTKK